MSAFETDEGLVLVDTGLFGPGVQEQLRAWSERPVHTAIYSHGHVDHVMGAAVLEGARIVAHENVPVRFDRYRLTAGWNGAINARQFQLPEYSFPTDFRYPDQTYRDELTLEVGGERFELRHSRGETDDHTWTWVPGRRILCCGDLFIWATPNAGNPQKVQRYPGDWAVALREMADLGAELMLPGHGPPLRGADRIRSGLSDTAALLESICEQAIALMNEGASLDELLRRVRAPAELLERPWLRPVYDEPDFIVRNIWRFYGGWWDGNPASLKPAAEADLAAELAGLAGGAERLAERAERAGRLRRAAAGRPPGGAGRACRPGIAPGARGASRRVRAPRAGGGVHDGPRDLRLGGRRVPPRAGGPGAMSAGQIAAGGGALAFTCLATWRLRTGRRGRAVLGFLVAIVLALVAADLGSALPSGGDAVRDAGDSLGGWAYPLMAAMAFLETTIPPVTLVFPGEWVVLFGGAMAGEGSLAIVPLMLIVWACSAVGDSVCFAMGRRLGRPFLHRYGRGMGLTEARLDRVDGWLDRYGPPAVCFGRLLPLARPFGPFVAGASHFPYRRFLPWSIVGTLLFTLLFCGAGYAFYNSYDDVAKALGRGALVLLVLIVAAIFGVRAVRRRRAREATG